MIFKNVTGTGKYVFTYKCANHINVTFMQLYRVAVESVCTQLYNKLYIKSVLLLHYPFIVQNVRLCICTNIGSFFLNHIRITINQGTIACGLLR